MIIEGMHYNPNCNCKQCVKTTKLNNTMTQKCCDKSTTQPWQERFDKEFWFLSDIKVTANWKEDKDKAEVLQEIYNNISKNVKQFIQQELDRQRSEIREKIKLMEIYDIDDTSLTPIAMHGYNQAINEIIKLL
jgi:hypothetical protein